MSFIIMCVVAWSVPAIAQDETAPARITLEQCQTDFERECLFVFLEDGGLKASDFGEYGRERLIAALAFENREETINQFFGDTLDSDTLIVKAAVEAWRQEDTETFARLAGEHGKLIAPNISIILSLLFAEKEPFPQFDQLEDYMASLVDDENMIVLIKMQFFARTVQEEKLVEAYGTFKDYFERENLPTGKFFDIAQFLFAGGWDELALDAWDYGLSRIDWDGRYAPGMFGRALQLLLENGYQDQAQAAIAQYKAAFTHYSEVYERFYLSNPNEFAPVLAGFGERERFGALEGLSSSSLMKSARVAADVGNREFARSIIQKADMDYIFEPTRPGIYQTGMAATYLWTLHRVELPGQFQDTLNRLIEKGQEKPSTLVLTYVKLAAFLAPTNPDLAQDYLSRAFNLLPEFGKDGFYSNYIELLGLSKQVEVELFR